MKIVFYTDAAGDIRWRVEVGNGRILADSGQAYSRITDARRGVEAVTGRRVYFNKGRAFVATVDGTGSAWAVEDQR